MRILGLDPGLAATGWGVIDARDNKLSHVANGVVRTKSEFSLAQRLVQIDAGLADVIGRFQPTAAAVEETFVNRNPASALKLGQARGVILVAASRAGLEVAEYSPNVIKKTVVGAGHAAKEQIGLMVRVLLPGSDAAGADAADALAVAICHAHHRQTAARVAAALP